VTSPAEHCAEPASGKVKRVRMPLQVLPAVQRFSGGSAAGLLRWVPLVLALERAEARPEESPGTGPQLLSELLKNVLGKEAASAGVASQTAARSEEVNRTPP
jgi:hypothetical protein